MPLSKTRSASIYSLRNPAGDPFNYDPTNNSELEIIGLILWITEGDKTQLSLANGNPYLITKYLEFLRKVCHFDEQKIKAVIHCHDSLTYSECLNYWSNLTGIPHARFTKPHIKVDKGGTRKFPYGILRIAACNIKLVNIFNERLSKLGLLRT